MLKYHGVKTPVLDIISGSGSSGGVMSAGASSGGRRHKLSKYTM
jgi:hypothetical protein